MMPAPGRTPAHLATESAEMAGAARDPAPQVPSLILYRCARCTALIETASDYAEQEMRAMVDAGKLWAPHACADGAHGVAQLIGTGPGAGDGAAVHVGREWEGGNVSDPVSAFPKFAERVRSRLEAGRAYEAAMPAVDRSTLDLIGEIEDELADVAGWACALTARLERLRGLAARVDEDAENVARARRGEW